MKPALKVSIFLNLVLIGGLFFIVLQQRREKTSSTRPDSVQTNFPAKVTAASATGTTLPAWNKSFRWGQLVSTNDYRVFVANLRAIGCPEPTVFDIVKGDADRAFAFERSQLHLDGSGKGPWSQFRETQLVASLLGAQPIEQSSATETAVAKTSRATQNAELKSQPTALASSAEQQPSVSAETAEEIPDRNQNSAGKMVSTMVSYPLVFQKANLDTLGLSGGQKAAIEQVQQQFVNDIGGLNQNPDDPAYLARWQTAQQIADDQLRGELGTQLYMAYKLQIYYSNFKQKIQNAGNGPLTINPDELSKQN